jgi:EAL domain-containing protein (putative c-di-GMP-specific phosphodiesterase class I)
MRLLAYRKCKASFVLMSGLGRRILESAEEVAKALGLSVIGRLEKPLCLAAINEIFEQHIRSETEPACKSQESIHFQDAELRNAIERDEFVLHYQPQMDIVTGELVGVEALVRWQHPEGYLIYPDLFMQRAEHLGLMQQLDWLVARRACSEIRKSTSQGIHIPNLSVNCSVHSLSDLTFPDRFVSLAAEFEISPEKLIIEITESGAIRKMACTLDVLTRLRMKRVQLSIDDFGTGYSMMQQLRNVPATELKIEKTFVQNMRDSESDRIMVLKTIEIGHALDMRVVAEGVETPEQLRFLSRHRCDVAQGYLFSKPLPVEAISIWIENYRLESRIGGQYQRVQSLPQRPQQQSTVPIIVDENVRNESAIL